MNKLNRREFLRLSGITALAFGVSALTLADAETIYPTGCPYCGRPAPEYDWTMSDVHSRHCHHECWAEHAKRVRPEVLRAYATLRAKLPGPLRHIYEMHIRSGLTQELAALKTVGKI